MKEGSSLTPAVVDRRAAGGLLRMMEEADRRNRGENVDVNKVRQVWRPGTWLWMALGK